MRSDRLLELAAHLKSDRRGHKIFDFGLFSVGQRDPKRHGCGTAGCAFGELPVIWPNDWDFGRAWGNTSPSLYGVRLKSKDWPYANAISARLGACKWFELSPDEVYALFYAERELAEASPIKPLPKDATAHQVADRFIAFVKWREEQADEDPKLNARLNWLEHPPAQVVENTETPNPVTCPECGGTAIESKGCTAILWDRGIQHHCQRCEHYWRVIIKDWYKRDMEKRRKVYRIGYNHNSMKPTFIHVRAISEVEALIAFVDGMTSMQIEGISVDDEYDGPLLSERVESPAGNAPERPEEAPPPGVYEAVVLIAGKPDRYGHIHSEEVLREMAAKEKGYKIRLEYGKVALVAKVTVPVAHVQETSDADDIQTNPVVRKGA